MTILSAAGQRGLHLPLDTPWMPVGSKPGLWTVVGWLEATKEEEDEAINNQTSMEDTGSDPRAMNQSKRTYKSDVPTGPRGV